jgi:hypothetical protein
VFPKREHTRCGHSDTDRRFRVSLTLVFPTGDVPRLTRGLFDQLRRPPCRPVSNAEATSPVSQAQTAKTAPCFAACRISLPVARSPIPSVPGLQPHHVSFVAAPCGMNNAAFDPQRQDVTPHHLATCGDTDSIVSWMRLAMREGCTYFQILRQAWKFNVFLLDPPRRHGHTISPVPHGSVASSGC